MVSPMTPSPLPRAAARFGSDAIRASTMQATISVLPRHTSVRFPGRPWVTYGLMLAIMAVMCLEAVVAVNLAHLEAMVNTYGLVSSDFQWSDPAAYIPLVTFNFLHSSGRHFGGNAIIMLFVCAAVERHAGRRATLFVWLVGGVASGIAHLVVMPDTSQSLVGASGAISAMLGAAFVIGWRWALPVRFRRSGRTFFHIPLPAVTAIWVAFQAVSFVRTIPNLSDDATIATWVHLAGFAFGVLAAGILCLQSQRRPDVRPQPHFSLAGD